MPRRCPPPVDEFPCLDLPRAGVICRRPLLARRSLLGLRAIQLLRNRRCRSCHRELRWVAWTTPSSASPRPVAWMRLGGRARRPSLHSLRPALPSFASFLLPIYPLSEIQLAPRLILCQFATGPTATA